MDFNGCQAHHKIFIFGESLFAEGIAKMLSAQVGFNIVGQSSMIDVALEIIETKQANLIIFDNSQHNKKNYISILIFKFPNLNFIITDLTKQFVQIVSSHLIQPKVSSILTAIQLLHHQNEKYKNGY